jgi:hypothetical protein
MELKDIVDNETKINGIPVPIKRRIGIILASAAVVAKWAS